MSLLPGQIYTADFPEVRPHPVIVISRPELNRGSYALVVPCTSARFEQRSQLPSCVPFRTGEFGFVKDCVAQCENSLSIEIAQLDIRGGPLGQLDDIAFRDLIRAIGYVLNSNCEPE